MRRKTIIAGSVVAALATGGVFAVSGGAQGSQGRTIELVSKGGTFKFVDVPPRARTQAEASAGDQYLLSTELRDSANKRLGTLDGRCSLTRGGRNLRGICDGSYSLGDGELHLMFRLGTNDDVSGSIVGGTGAYAGARGTFVSVDRPGTRGGDPSDDTITLLP